MAQTADRNSPQEGDARRGPSGAGDQHPLPTEPQLLVEPQVPSYRYLELSHNGAEVFIEYEGKRYRLRTTKNGKLILNK